MNDSGRDIKLSIIVTARNDDHGGGFMNRMQIFVNGLLAQCNRHKLSAELIIVEWNPPADKPGLSQALIWPEESGHCTVRIIEVPPEIHKRYKYAHKLPLYQMIAKNVGMRRARGRFILATNIDVLFSDELMRFLAAGELREGVLYRIDRTDVPEDVDPAGSIDEQLEYCLENIIRINCREGTYQKLTGRYYASYGHLDVVLTNLHFNACGDFTLMSTADWLRLRGYPEFDMYSPHLDSLMLVISYYAGIRQEILREPMRLYHLEHGGAWVAEHVNKLEEEKKSEAIPVLKLSQFEGWTSEMKSNGVPIIFNDGHWGFSTETLRDTKVLSAKWEHASELVVTDNTNEHVPATGIDENTEKSILIIADNFPMYDSETSKALYDITAALAGHCKVTIVARKGIEKGKYIEHLRKLGVIVFYDIEGLMEQTSTDMSSVHQYAVSVSVEKLLAHYTFDAVLLGTPGISPLYLSVVRDISPRSPVVVNALGPVTAEKCYGPEEIYVYEETDVVIATPETAGTLSGSIPGVNIRTVSGPGEPDLFKKELSLLIDSLSQREIIKSDRFRISPGSLTGPHPCFEKSVLTVVFVMNDNTDASHMSLESLLKYSDPKLTNVIVALNAKQCGNVKDKLERKLKYYFTYENEQERDTYIMRIIGQCSSEYAAVTESCVIVSPYWDRRLTAHFRDNAGLGAIYARPSEFLYDSIYEFEKDAYSIYQHNRGRKKMATGTDLPCLVFRPSLCGRNNYQNLKAFLKDLSGSNSIAVALDTSAMHLRRGLKEKKPLSLPKSRGKALSVVVPVHKGGHHLEACLNSLFIQKDINYEDIEIIVVYIATDESTKGLLNGIKAPCSLKCFGLSENGLAAALNHGVREASGEYVLFVSQEDVACETLIYQHFKTHSTYDKKDIAVLGHISLADVDDYSLFVKFLSKTPKLTFASPYFYNYSDIGDPEDAGHFYLPNVSLKREIFKKAGMFEEDMPDEWIALEFGSRLALKGYRVVCNLKADVVYNVRTCLDEHIEGQIRAGRQFAVMACRHPYIWNIEGAKKISLCNYIGKEKLMKLAKETAGMLESMPEDVRDNYKYAGLSLIDKCFYILSNYYFSQGISDGIRWIEDEGWFVRYAKEQDTDIEDINNRNRAYELLFESYRHIGNGDSQAFTDCVERSSGLLPGHPGPYYAVASLYFNMNEYKLAESTFEQGIERRRNYQSDLIFPAEDESLYMIWLAMSCIPQGKYKKAAEVLEQLISERMNIPEEQGMMVYKCLGLCYRALGKNAKAAACIQEAERLQEGIPVAKTT